MGGGRGRGLDSRRRRGEGRREKEREEEREEEEREEEEEHAWYSTLTFPLSHFILTFLSSSIFPFPTSASSLSLSLFQSLCSTFTTFHRHTFLQLS